MKNIKHFRAFKHKSCIKVNLRFILTGFLHFSSGITLEITTLPTSRKSVIVKNYPETYFI